LKGAPAKKFRLVAPFKPKGSQPLAIRHLLKGFSKKERFQTLLGVTGSGKTFTIANVISELNRPAIVIAHNKTLAAQLYNEFKEFFPDNRVEYFVSYYDYYQPESYIPQRDLYIEKDAQINPRLEQLRLSATASLLSRRDTIIVASVSCIYGLGDPKNFQALGFEVSVGEAFGRKRFQRRLIDCQYARNDTELSPGRFRVKGDTIDLIPGYGKSIFRIEFFGDIVERISEIDDASGKVLSEMKYLFVYPAKHFVIPETEKLRAIESIRKELETALPSLGALEAQRLKQRTLYDIEMLKETGYCKGIENYSRHFDGRLPGSAPYTLLDYFPEDFLLFIDESHQTIPQLNGMYNGDRSRKKALIDYGFRLPSAFDNRPLKFPEFEEKFMRSVVFVSATPGEYELQKSGKGNVAEQIVRPTGLLDPPVSIRKAKGQIEDVSKEIALTAKRGERSLVTTLTKRLAEDLSEFLSQKGIKTRYLHSEIETLERTEIIRELRLGKFDCLVGINLLREGLDIPEVGFIGILDADKEGFLRDERSLIQTIGRAARNINSKVILYADRETASIKRALSETERRRRIQANYNILHKIRPKTIVKPIRDSDVRRIKDVKHIPKAEIPGIISSLESDMNLAAERLEFEEAISLRDKILELRKRLG